MTDFSRIVPKYSLKEIEEFDNEDRFVEADVELFKQVISMLYSVIELKYFNEDGKPNKIEINDAVVGGNLTRLFKLNKSFLQNICERRLEICYILSRCIAETFINTKFILVDSEESVKRNYIKYSLITEKQLFETISSIIIERGGDVLPIEERMKYSINNSFDVSDFEIDNVFRSSKWKSIKSRADIVAGNVFYNVYYGISSHSVHGNWQDILFNHLIRFDDGFKLKLNWSNPVSQVIEAPIALNLDILKIFCEKELTGIKYGNIILAKCIELTEYLKLLMEYHDKFINKNFSE